MNLMLTAILAFTALGLLAHRVGPRQQAIVALIALGMTALYFLQPARFM